VDESYENDTSFDVTYVALVWVSFVPGVVVPWLFGRLMLFQSAMAKARAKRIDRYIHNISSGLCSLVKYMQ
jgi:hypothetical protein